VHDEAGNPVLRVSDVANGSLTTWLSSVAKLLRDMLGPEPRIVLAFDRGGAFPDQLVDLRDAGFELVTYERKPYPLLAPTAFDIAFTHDGETLEACDARTNLGGAHGRLRRIALRAGDRRQVNLLAVGSLSASELYAILRGRWVQGLARNELAVLAKNDPRRGRWDAILTRATTREQDLLALRPTTPTRAPLRETELADKLVRHSGDYKMALDSVRIACANVESDLAAILAETMVLPAQAKKVLANIFQAPGHVVVGQSVITVRLAPAANRTERDAIANLFAHCNRLKLTLPGDLAMRPLRFQAQNI
jgi:hypothetical protein